MDQEIDQVVQAIAIAFDQSQISLHQQALAYISTIQQNASETWRLALKLFVTQNADGSRKYPSQARFFALRVLDEFFDNRWVIFFVGFLKDVHDFFFLSTSHCCNPLFLLCRS
jgi:exportin-T